MMFDGYLAGQLERQCDWVTSTGGVVECQDVDAPNRQQQAALDPCNTRSAAHAIGKQCDRQCHS